MNKIDDSKQELKIEIEVTNFGPIAEANIDLRPLTVFVGPSNTGKTYFATLVYALHNVFPNLSKHKQFLSYGLEHCINILRSLRMLQLKNDTNESLKTKIEDILNKLGDEESVFRLSDLPDEILQLIEYRMDDSHVFGNRLKTELSNCFDLDSIEELKRLIRDQSNDITLTVMVGKEIGMDWSINMRTKESNIDFNSSLNKYMVLLPTGFAVSTEWDGKGGFNCNIISELDVDLSDDRNNLFESHMNRHHYYLPAARSGIMQSHRIIASSLVKRTTQVGLQQFPELPTLSGVIADFMQQIILYEEVEKPNDELKLIAETLESDVLIGKILQKPSKSGYPDFYYSPNDIKKEMRLSKVSSMVSELAPLVLYLRGLVNPGDTLIIEEPEAHLHPGAQSDMAVILARLIRAGVKVIITTHSDWLLQEIGNLILEGILEQKPNESESWLSPEEVGVWHFQKNKPVEEIKFNSREGISPEDYEDVAEGLYNRSVNLQQRYERQKRK